MFPALCKRSLQSTRLSSGFVVTTNIIIASNQSSCNHQLHHYHDHWPSWSPTPSLHSPDRVWRGARSVQASCSSCKPPGLQTYKAVPLCVSQCIGSIEQHQYQSEAPELAGAAIKESRIISPVISLVAFLTLIRKSAVPELLCLAGFRSHYPCQGPWAGFDFSHCEMF